MFEVREKGSNPRLITSRYAVFDVRNDKTGYPHFLIYRDGQWLWRSAKHFEPVSKTHNPLRG